MLRTLYIHDFSNIFFTCDFVYLGFNKLSQLTNLKVLDLQYNYLLFPNVLSSFCWISSLEVLILNRVPGSQMGTIEFPSLKNRSAPIGT